MKEYPAYVCSHVFKNERPILLVSTEGGDWQFLCGQDHKATETPRVVGLEHLIERDPTLREILDLDRDSEAERTSPGSPWSRRRA